MQRNTPFQEYLHHFFSRENAPRVSSVRAPFLETAASERFTSFIEAFENSPAISPSSVDFSCDAVTVGQRSDLTNSEYQQLLHSLQAFIPWKKGPWNLFGVEIDSEWQSQIKWQRFLAQNLPISGKKIADIGCNNGYFMYRMLEFSPDLVVGFEPFLKHFWNFHLVNKYVKSEKLFFEPLGVEHIDLFPKFFDTIFCLGILYHHTDPIGILRKMFSALDKGGYLFIDCQGVEGESSQAYFPAGKYAGAKGFWWLPTKPCLENWLKRAGFRNIETFYAEKLTPAEQRTTEWAPIKSLADFLTPEQDATVEGHPPPIRIYLKAQR